jgi:hypothetical protein
LNKLIIKLILDFIIKMGNAIGKPAGADDRWTNEETSWVKIWLEE